MTPSFPRLVRLLHLQRCQFVQIINGKIQTLLWLKDKDFDEAVKYLYFTSLFLSEHWNFSSRVFIVSSLDWPRQLLSAAMTGKSLAHASHSHRNVNQRSSLCRRSDRAREV